MGKKTIYYDSYSGLLPVQVTSMYIDRQRCDVRITYDHPPYKRGEYLYGVHASRVVHKSHVRNGKQLVVNAL